MKLKDIFGQEQRGFTLIELMIATMVFSVILLLCVFGLVQVGNTYYRGLTSSQTQNAARAISDDIVQSIQFDGGTVISSIPASTDPVPTVTTWANPGATGAFCLGDKRYTYLIGRQVVDSSPNANQAYHAFVIDKAPTGPCNPLSLSTSALPPITQPEELVPVNARLDMLSVKKDTTSPTANGLYTIEVRVSSGDITLIDPTSHNCKGEAGSQFCAVSYLYTVAKERIY